MNPPIDLGDTNNQKREEPVVIPENTPNPSSSEPASGKTEPSASAKEPIVKNINVKVDLSKKPEEIKEPINLLNDDEFFKKQTNPTEGDLNQDKKQEEKVNEFKQTISDTPASSSSSKTVTPEKRKAQAEKWVKAIDIAILWGLKAWSGQADDVGLKTGSEDKQTLADALADVMEEYNFNPAPLLTLAITAVAVYGTPVTNAIEKRKIIRALRKKEPERVKEAKDSSVKEKPEFDPATGKHIKRRGGQFKA